MAKSRLIIFDTTNFIDFPIGGQLTSVSNFLRYLCEMHADRCGDIVLVGVTKQAEKVGVISKQTIHGTELTFLPAAACETDLGHTAHSLRLAFAKGILKHGRQLHISSKDCCYIQTPEAFGPIKVLCPLAQCVIFSHGSYANMDRGFRFFRNNPLVRKAFGIYLKMVIRMAKLIFVLDNDSMRDYSPYTKRLVKAGNSIALPSDYASWKVEDKEYQGRLLFVGRLSKDKGVGGIIEAVDIMRGLSPDAVSLTIVGDGEEGENLRALAAGNEAVTFTGAVPPSVVAEHMRASDILIMNSAFEGVPMTILEALSHGLPVISTNVGGIADTVNFGEDAEETDGTPSSIIRAINAISMAYPVYAAKAHEHGAAYDYHCVGKTVYDGLSRFWK